MKYITQSLKIFCAFHLASVALSLSRHSTLFVYIFPSTMLLIFNFCLHLSYLSSLCSWTYSPSCSLTFLLWSGFFIIVKLLAFQCKTMDNLCKTINISHWILSSIKNIIFFKRFQHSPREVRIFNVKSQAFSNQMWKPGSQS